MDKIKIKYYKNSCQYGDLIKDNKWFVFLDSCNDVSSFGKYDILTSNPYMTIASKGNSITINENGVDSYFTDNPFDIIKKYFNVNSDVTDLPFSSGMIGYFGYEALSKFDNDGDFPDIAVGFYDWAIVINHEKKESILVFKKTNHFIENIINIISSINISNMSSKGYSFSNFQQTTSKEKYIKDISKIKKYITNGDCYQVNYSQNFTAEYSGNPWDIYKKIRIINPAPYSSFISFDERYIISSSPERFISVNKNMVETKPIKGTIKRLKDKKLDQKQIDILKHDKKNISENLMIVDLLRNDLSKCCELSTVKVSKLFDIESYASVHHMVSTIEGKLNPENTSISILEACFPGGSITGAPKKRSMEIISELENRKRNVYCGSIGYFNENNNMDTNICIRTIMMYKSKLNFAAGGGIVYDSIPEDEYHESLDKVSIFIDFFSNGEFKW